MLYILLLLHSFAAATLFPIGSEPTLLLSLEQGHKPLFVLIVATLGNTVGSMVNWWIGLYLLRFRDRKWFPFSEQSLQSAQQRFSRWGVWVLFFAWLPVIGDPLTLVAGIMRVKLLPFLLIVGCGKCLRYLVFVLPYWI